MSLESVDILMRRALSEGRFVLLEHETYEVLSSAGLTTAPDYLFLPADFTETDVKPVKSKNGSAVLKIVSPFILHKTDVGGVRIVENDPTKLAQTARAMLDTVPDAFVSWARRSGASLPPALSGLKDNALADTIRKSLRGVLAVPFIEPDTTGFGYECLAGMQWSREFGPVVTVGLGGVDTELYARNMKPGAATVNIGAADTTPQAMLDVFRSTLAYRKSTGSTRGGKAVATEKVFLDLFGVFLKLAAYFGPEGRSPYVIRELEINPLVFSGGRIVPLDGLCRFGERAAAPPPSPTHKIKQLLHPKSMAVIGVSARKLNMGRIILRNVKGKGFDTSHLYIIRPGETEIDGIPCVPSLAALPETADVLVLAVDASQAPGIIKEAAESGKVESVIIIPGGLAEKSGTEDIVKDMNDAIYRSREKPGGGPVFVGGNCLGILSRPGRYDTLFVPEQKLPKNYEKEPDPIAILSQSGARMITVMSRHHTLSPRYIISTGNQMDMGISDFLEYMSRNEPDIKVFAVYVEGFRDLGGLRLMRTVRRLAHSGKDIIFYKAGRTAAGRTATSGHTASIAGDYDICATLLQQAGAIVCNNFTEFNDLLRLAASLHNKTIRGNRLAAISNAGYETVGIADNIEGEFGFQLAGYSRETQTKLAEILKETRLEKLIDVRNPMDVTPMADDAAHEAIIRAQLEDPNVDCYVASTVPLSPTQQTLPGGIFGKEDIHNENSYPNRLIRIARDVDKPLIASVDSGELYDPMVKMIEKAGLVVFRTVDHAVRVFAKYVGVKLRNTSR